MKFTGASGITYLTADAPLGRGGEGRVLEVESVRRGSAAPSRPRPGDLRLVVKEFNPGHADAARQAKLAAMVACRPSGGVARQLAWPVDLVTRRGSFAGFVMPKVGAAHHLNEYYVAGAQGIGGPAGRDATYARQLTLAHNLAVAVACVHDLGQVIGDLNPANALVDEASWNVTLIDCDSFHITDAAGHTHRCAVGMAEYLAPEVHAALRRASGVGASLATLDPSPYSRQTDLFALAIHVFALLMNGCHPFACAVDARWGSHGSGARGCPQPVDNIVAGFSPFFARTSGLTTPRYAPSTASLTPELRALFKQAFVRGHAHPDERPDARAWAGALRQALGALDACPVCGTERPAGCACPRCEVTAHMQGLASGGSASGASANAAAFVSVLSQIAAKAAKAGPASHVQASHPTGGARARGGGSSSGAARRTSTSATGVLTARAKAGIRSCMGIGIVGALGLAWILQVVPAHLPYPPKVLLNLLLGNWHVWAVLGICTVALLAKIKAPRGDGRDGRRLAKSSCVALFWSAVLVTAVLFTETILTTDVADPPLFETLVASFDSAVGDVAIVGLPTLALVCVIYGLVGSLMFGAGPLCAALSRATHAAGRRLRALATRITRLASARTTSASAKSSKPGPRPRP